MIGGPEIYRRAFLKGIAPYLGGLARGVSTLSKNIQEVGSSRPLVFEIPHGGPISVDTNIKNLKDLYSFSGSAATEIRKLYGDLGIQIECPKAWTYDTRGNEPNIRWENEEVKFVIDAIRTKTVPISLKNPKTPTEVVLLRQQNLGRWSANGGIGGGYDQGRVAFTSNQSFNLDSPLEYGKDLFVDQKTLLTASVIHEFWHSAQDAYPYEFVLPWVPLRNWVHDDPNNPNAWNRDDKWRNLRPDLLWNYSNLNHDPWEDQAGSISLVGVNKSVVVARAPEVIKFLEQNIRFNGYNGVLLNRSQNLVKPI